MNGTIAGRKLAGAAVGIAGCGVVYEWLSRIDGWRQEGFVSWALLVGLTALVGVYAVLVAQRTPLRPPQRLLLAWLLAIQVPSVSLGSVKYLMFVGLGLFVESTGPSGVFLRASFGGRLLLEIPNRGEVHGIGVNVIAALILASLLKWGRSSSDRA